MYAIKKDLLTSTLPQFYKLSFYEDVCNIPKIIYKAKKVLILNFDGYNYYRNNESISKNINSKEKLENFTLAHKNLISYFKKELGSDNDLFIQIKNYYDYHLKRKTKELKS